MRAFRAIKLLRARKRKGVIVCTGGVLFSFSFWFFFLFLGDALGSVTVFETLWIGCGSLHYLF